MIDKNKIVFITIDWMKHYKGITENDKPLGTGGSYPKEQKNEIYNFLDDDGVCHGFTPPRGKLNLERIYKNDIKTNPDGHKYLENVLVIFNGSSHGGDKRKIIGFYIEATVFNEPYENKNPKRRIESNKEFAKYNVVTKVENTFLLEEKDRNIILPNARTSNFGYGQSNIWYADNNDEKVKQFRDETCNKIESIIKDTIFAETCDDEKKYVEGGINKSVKEVSKIKRNGEARKKCIEYYFPNNEHYTCQICGFDFEKKYGKRFIEVHHVRSHTLLSREKGEHEIDPKSELIPVCSNCHSIIHIEKEPLEVAKIKELVKRNANDI